MDFTFLADLHKEFAPPEGGILSRILHKDGKVNITLFGFRPDVTPVDLPRFSQPSIAGVSRFRFVGEYISPPS